MDTDTYQEYIPSNTTSTIQTKRQISDSSSQKSSTPTKTLPSPTNPEITKTSKNPKYFHDQGPP